MSPENHTGKSIGRVAYINIIQGYSEGILRKLEEQSQAALKLDLPVDVHWITGPGNMSQNPKTVNTVFIKNRNKILLRIKQALHVNELSRKYDALYLRYPTVDPMLFAAFRPVNPVISEHHTKEPDELKLLRDWRYPLELRLGGSFLRRFKGISGVTEEIINFELARIKEARPTLLLANCIDTSRYSNIDLQRPILREPRIKMVMTSSEFVPWQGLDKILNILENVPAQDYELHLCGRLSAEQKQRISQFPSVKAHGLLADAELKRVIWIAVSG